MLLHNKLASSCVPVADAAFQDVLVAPPWGADLALFTARPKILPLNAESATRMRRNPVFALAAVLVAFAAVERAAAQEMAPPTHVSFNTGLFQFELAGSGYAPMLAFRAATPLTAVLIIEGALLAARPGQQFGETTTFIVPEAQVQLALPFTTVVPYMGLGVGAAIDFRGGAGGGTQTDLTISGSLGIKTWFSDTVGAQAEFRGRGIDPDFTGSSSEYTVGMIWQP